MNLFFNPYSLRKHEKIYTTLKMQHAVNADRIQGPAYLARAPVTDRGLIFNQIGKL